MDNKHLQEYYAGCVHIAFADLNINEVIQITMNTKYGWRYTPIPHWLMNYPDKVSSTKVQKYVNFHTIQN